MSEGSSRTFVAFWVPFYTSRTLLSVFFFVNLYTFSVLVGFLAFKCVDQKIHNTNTNMIYHSSTHKLLPVLKVGQRNESFLCCTFPFSRQNFLLASNSGETIFSLLCSMAEDLRGHGGPLKGP